MSLKVPGLFRFVIFLKARIKFLFASVVGLKRQTPLTLVIRQLKNFKRVIAPTLLFCSLTTNFSCFSMNFVTLVITRSPARFVRVFASDFLQIPLHNGHPCLSLTVPIIKPVTDFHRQVVTHPGRSKNADKSAVFVGSLTRYYKLYRASMIYELKI